MLMDADNRSVDHLDSRIMGNGECVYDTAPDAHLDTASTMLTG
jgi:hypothetical protein